jgi:hypothetical protein
MDSRTLSALILLNDLRHAAMDAMREKRKLPSLLLLYSFIDICASLAEESPARTNRDRFENFLRAYALANWRTFTPYDLWAARSSLLHAYSPLGDHTDKPGGAKPIFYYSWPETPEKVREALVSRGYKDFLLLDVATIKTIAVSCFNGVWRRVQDEPEFELVLRRNAEHLLKDFQHMQLENELAALQDLATMTGGEE